MYSLRIWFILFVAAISSYSLFAYEEPEYIPVYDYVELFPQICNENQTKHNCNFQSCATSKDSSNSYCEGDWNSCKCKNGYWLNSSNDCVLREDCDVHPRFFDSWY
ncbi:uncharacterized protein LOC141528626 [Cotesia typhae]|uniref:uncharacterized protein LOC141528626 n=1 Tax=Cotesia typhae TaxID=2053667 RepID=UPI003D681E23